MTHSGGKPHHVGDHGQRFEVTYVDDFGFRKKFGWSNDMDGVNRMLRSIAANPSMKDAEFTDREALF